MLKKSEFCVLNRIFPEGSCLLLSSWRNEWLMLNRWPILSAHCGDRKRMFNSNIWEKTSCFCLRRWMWPGQIKVIVHKPWTYNKHLVVFERVVENVPISTLSLRFFAFWIQIHDLPSHCLNSVTRDTIGRSLGTLLLMTDSKEEGGKGNYLRIHVKANISQYLLVTPEIFPKVFLKKHNFSQWRFQEFFSKCIVV